MTTTLIQRDLIRGTQEFELVDDHVNVRIKPPFRKEERLTVMLTVIDPEPVIGKSTLEFNSRVNGEPLISLFLGKPDTDTFNAFVNTLKQMAFEEYNAFAGLQSNTTTRAAGLGDNVMQAPEDIEEASALPRNRSHIKPERLDEAIEMLNRHLDPEDVKPLVEAMEALKGDTQSDPLLAQVLHAFNELGPYQGAVLTYAPYVSILLYDDPFSNM